MHCKKKQLRIIIDYIQSSCISAQETVYPYPISDLYRSAHKWLHSLHLDQMGRWHVLDEKRSSFQNWCCCKLTTESQDHLLSVIKLQTWYQQDRTFSLVWLRRKRFTHFTKYWSTQKTVLQAELTFRKISEYINSLDTLCWVEFYLKSLLARITN